MSVAALSDTRSTPIGGYDLIASPYLDHHLVVRPGTPQGLALPRAKYLELAQAPAGSTCPQWLTNAVSRSWGLDIAGRQLAGTVLVRPASPNDTGQVWARASWELNLGCNYDCEHCYLGLKKFEGLDWDGKVNLLHLFRDAGVLWLQMTGGEPIIDKHFLDSYALAYDLGMMVQISTNGSRLYRPAVLDMLTTRKPFRMVVSVYGATEESYDGLTRRRGAFKAFSHGIRAGIEAGLPIRLNLIVTKTNAHEEQAMRNMADAWGLPYVVYANISPTIYGGQEALVAQSTEHLKLRKPFTGCNAGHTFFHVDPFGVASICKVGREPNVQLMDEGVGGLLRLGEIADSLLLRQGGCSGCTLSGSCGTCMPLVTLYRKANASLASYCQHGHRKD